MINARWQKVRHLGCTEDCFISHSDSFVQGFLFPDNESYILSRLYSLSKHIVLLLLFMVWCTVSGNKYNVWFFLTGEILIKSSSHCKRNVINTSSIQGKVIPFEESLLTKEARGCLGKWRKPKRLLRKWKKKNKQTKDITVFSLSTSLT